MKKIILFFIFVIFCATLYADSSKEFTFIWDALGALRFCQAAIDYRITSKIPPRQMILDTEQANVNFERAKQMLDKYAQDKDPLIKDCAAGIINGIDILVYSNDVLAAKLESVAGLHPGGFDNAESETARFRGQSKRGWKEFFSSLSRLSPLVVESAQNGRETLFKISKEERQKLAERIKELFKEGAAAPEEEIGQNTLEIEKLDLHTRFAASVAAIKDLLVMEAAQ